MQISLSTDIALKRNCSSALLRLSTKPPLQESIVLAGAVDALCNLYLTPDSAMKSDCVEALCNLIKVRRSRTRGMRDHPAGAAAEHHHQSSSWVVAFMCLHLPGSVFSTYAAASGDRPRPRVVWGRLVAAAAGHGAGDRPQDALHEAALRPGPPPRAARECM
jgi:hypothetical protein